MDPRTWLDQPQLDDDFPLPLDSPFTPGQALAAGLSRRWLARLVDAGLLTRPIRGVYTASHLPDSIETRTACLRLIAPEDAVICDRHAGWLHGAEMVLMPNEHLHLRGVTMFLPAGRGRLRNALTDGGERSFLEEDLTEINGVRVTTPLRTAWDLGGHRFIEPAVSGMDAMLRLGSFTHAELVGGVERFRGARWVTTLREWAPFADGRAESPGESALRVRCLEAGLPDMTPQVEVSSRGRLARLDLGNLEWRFATEYDGEEWHSQPIDVAHDLARRRWLDLDEGWTLCAVGKNEVYGLDRQVLSILREGYAAAQRRVRRSA